MLIGIDDDCFYSLQARLLREGHSLVVHAGNVPVDPDNFNITHVDPVDGATITQVRSVSDLLGAGCDFYICGTSLSAPTYEMAKSLGLPAIGYNESLCALEHDRTYAHRILTQQGCTHTLSLPPQHAFSDMDSVEAFLEDADNSNSSWVFKQSLLSPQHVANNRTVVSVAGTHDQVLHLMRSTPNAWFDDKGVGGLVLEKYVDGYEVCFGRWFDGTQWVGPMYACEEHKGAQDNDRGSLLTGEVGGWLEWYHKPEGQIVNVFEQLTPIFRGNCSGMVDINTRINESGIHFIEFTVRYGRPTLEYMLATVADDCDLGETLYRLTGSALNQLSPDVFANTYDQTHACGVTVFSYGIPLLSDTNGIGPVPFNLPDELTSSRTFQQLFCSYDRDTDTWMTARNNRQFTIVGTSNVSMVGTDDSAQDYAYQWLYGGGRDAINILGCTWRSDVGNNYPDITALLTSLNILKGSNHV